MMDTGISATMMNPKMLLMRYVVAASKSHNSGYPKIAISTPITNTTTNEMIDHDHNLARNPRNFGEMYAPPL